MNKKNATSTSKLFGKYGEFDSAEEINREATARKAKGDLEAVKAIAAENGIDEMDAQDFFEGVIPELCTPLTAAIGKLDAEAGSLDHLPMMMIAWKEIIQGMLADSGNENLIRGIRKKGKRLAELFGRLIVECSKSRVNTPKEIVDYARKIDKNIPSTLPTADLSLKRFKELVKEYYIDKEVAPVQPQKPEQPEAADEAPAEDPEDSFENEGDSKPMMPEGGDEA